MADGPTQGDHRPLREATFREFIDIGAVSRVRLIGTRGGFTLTVSCGGIDRVLGNSRGSLRQFASLNTAVDFLRRVGLAKFEVDAEEYERARTRKPRPDRAEALRHTRTRPRQQPLI